MVRAALGWWSYTIPNASAGAFLQTLLKTSFRSSVLRKPPLARTLRVALGMQDGFQTDYLLLVSCVAS